MVLDEINHALEAYGVRIELFSQAVKDIKKYDPGTRKIILALLFRRGKQGPLLKPDGLGEPLGDDLTGFAKIKPKNMGFRIVYRTKKVGNQIHMEVLAVGPRDKNKVYEVAAARLVVFNKEMKDRRSE